MSPASVSRQVKRSSQRLQGASAAEGVQRASRKDLFGSSHSSESIASTSSIGSGLAMKRRRPPGVEEEEAGKLTRI